MAVFVAFARPTRISSVLGWSRLRCWWVHKGDSSNRHLVVSGLVLCTPRLEPVRCTARNHIMISLPDLTDKPCRHKSNNIIPRTVLVRYGGLKSITTNPPLSTGPKRGGLYCELVHCTTSVDATSDQGTTNSFGMNMMTSNASSFIIYSMNPSL